MKKIVSIFLVIFLVSLTFSVYATENPPTSDDAIDVNFERTTMDSEKVTVKINIGDFGNISTPTIMSASFTYSIDGNINRIEGQGLNGCNISIAEESSRIVIETDAAKPNTTIAEITFYFNQEISEETNGTIRFSELNLSDGDTFDYYYPEDIINYTIKPQEEENLTPEDPETPIDEEQVVPEQNIVIDTEQSQTPGTVNETSKETQSNIKNTDNTMSPDKKLPQTGISIDIIISIIILTILGVVGLVRYKQIQIK